MYAICQREPEKLKQIGDAFGVEKRYTELRRAAQGPAGRRGPHQHADPRSRAASDPGAARPASTWPAPCRWPPRSKIAGRSSSWCSKTGLKYMMMETVVYAREFLFVKELYDKGELGRVQFLQASHQQEMAGWPGYWEGLPPMHYATHCVGPCLALANARGGVRVVLRLGPDRREADPQIQLAVRRREHATSSMPNSDLAARIYRSLFNTARQYRESFDVYGSKKSFEWPLVEGEEPVMHTGEEPRAR